MNHNKKIFQYKIYMAYIACCINSNYLCFYINYDTALILQQKNVLA